MSKKIIHINEDAIKDELNELVRGCVEETLNDLLEKDAQELTQAAKIDSCCTGAFLFDAHVSYTPNPAKIWRGLSVTCIAMLLRCSKVTVHPSGTWWKDG